MVTFVDVPRAGLRLPESSESTRYGIFGRRIRRHVQGFHRVRTWIPGGQGAEPPRRRLRSVRTVKAT